MEGNLTRGLSPCELDYVGQFPKVNTFPSLDKTFV